MSDFRKLIKEQEYLIERLRDVRTKILDLRTEEGLVSRRLKSVDREILELVMRDKIA